MINNFYKELGMIFSSDGCLLHVCMHWLELANSPNRAFAKKVFLNTKKE
jgi:hypothetical protein